MTAAVAIREARPEDLGEITRLCAAHAAYERLVLTFDGHGDRLGQALFGPRPRLGCLVAGRAGRLDAYVTFAREYSTWRAAPFLHVDCLYVVASRRDEGIGRRLMETVARSAAAQGLTDLEWQTPAWNTLAARFYERLGASGLPKVRYTWRPGSALDG